MAPSKRAIAFTEFLINTDGAQQPADLLAMLTGSTAEEAQELQIIVVAYVDFAIKKNKHLWRETLMVLAGAFLAKWEENNEPHTSSK